MRFALKRGFLSISAISRGSCFKRLLNSKVPPKPIELFNEKCDKVNLKSKVSRHIILHLEKISLVDFGNQKGIKILEDAIQLADQLNTVNTECVEPFITVLEESELRLREDIVNEGKCRKKLLSNAVISEDDYFVAPPGNIPVLPKNLDYDNEMLDKKLKHKTS